MDFYRSGDKVCSDVTLDKNHSGWSDMVHGGIISTLFDEIMSWTVLYFERSFFVTKRMDVKYIRPIIIGTPLVISGQMSGHGKSPKEVKAKGEIRNKEGNLMAKSTGDFVKIKEEDLSFVSEEAKKEILEYFMDI